MRDFFCRALLIVIGEPLADVFLRTASTKFIVDVVKKAESVGSSAPKTDWLNWGSRSLEIRGQRCDEGSQDLSNCTSTFSRFGWFSPPYDDVSELCGVSKAPRIRSSPAGHQAHTPSRLRSATESHKEELSRDQPEMSTCEMKQHVQSNWRSFSLHFIYLPLWS